ncbi:MAG: epoxide hydrolase family protein [Pseudolysinimonas sp.]
MAGPPLPFTIDVPEAELDDLRRRLRATRWPDAVADDWSQGTAPGDLRRLVEHWGNAFDWRAAERRLNALDHVTVKVDGERIHAVRAGTPGATPLLLVHGWPDSFLRFEKAIPLLAARFELVIPSIPGYGFSDRPASALGPAGVARRFAQLMTALGHERFGVHGADIGSQIAEQLALFAPDRVIGLHLGDVPLRRLRALDSADLNEAELAWRAAMQEWEGAEGAYAHLQRTKPQTLAASLNDSPAGLASWVLEKFRAWSDCDGDVFSRFTLDELATNLTIYWVTQTAGSAGRYYLDARLAELDSSPVTTPTGIATFPKDLLVAPGRSAERWFNLQRLTQMPRGGHFGPWEEPESWSTEVIAFFDQLGA